MPTTILKNICPCESVLIRMGKMPKRELKDIAELEDFFDIILDATEHATQCPKGHNAQKNLYSGKKDLKSGMKKYRILVNRTRLKNKDTVNQVIGACATLWNLIIEI